MRGARCDHLRPTPRAASNVGTNATTLRQQVPWEYPKIVFEDGFALLPPEACFFLPVFRPFLAKTSGDIGVDIFVRGCAHTVPLSKRPGAASLHKPTCLRAAKDSGRPEICFASRTVLYLSLRDRGWPPTCC